MSNEPNTGIYITEVYRDEYQVRWGNVFHAGKQIEGVELFLMQEGESEEYLLKHGYVRTSSSTYNFGVDADSEGLDNTYWVLASQL